MDRTSPAASVPDTSPDCLERNESVLWNDAPDPALAVRAFVTRYPIWFVTALAVGAVVGAIAVGNSAGDTGITLLALLTAIAGILAFPLASYLKARATTYFVTTRRIIVSQRFPGTKIRTYGPDVLVPLRVVDSRPGQGDVYFAMEREAVGHPHCGCGAGLCPTPNGTIGRITESKERTIEAPVGFVGIRDPRAVAALISDQFGVPEVTHLH